MYNTNSTTLDYILKKFNIVFDENTIMPIEIPSTSRYDLAKWLRELNFKAGVEVGVAAGDYSRVLCELNPQMQLWGVDAWKSYDGYTDYPQEALDAFYGEAKKRLRSFRKRYHILKKFSVDAVCDFEDNSIDFVYIDANHIEPFISQDISLWSQKVRIGGIVAGHDYIKRIKDPWVVKDAVDKYVEESGISPLFVLGLKGVTPGMVRENTRSWMWVKM